MGTDLGGIIREVAAFYDFTGKSVIVAGAGGGRLIDYLQSASRVIAVDDDAEAIKLLGEVVRVRGLGPPFELVQAEFRTVLTPGDAVVLEFCLHEMADPKQALDHARTLAPDVIVVDHAPGSMWSWYAGEEAGVEAAWAAVAQAAVRHQRDVDAVQHFADFNELAARLASQGTTSLARIETLRDVRPIIIPMPYRLVLIDGTPP